MKKKKNNKTARSENKEVQPVEAPQAGQMAASGESFLKRPIVIQLIPILIIVIASFAVYFNALPGDFVYDDKHQIIENPWIRDFGNIPTIFSRSVWGFRPGMFATNFYRPFMHLVYAIAYHLFGLRPWGFHLVNILFHCGVSVLVYLFVQRLLPEKQLRSAPRYLSPPLIAALLFAVHPIHTEAVTWIAGLPDVAFTFFYLLSLYLYISFGKSLSISYYISLLSFVAAAFFKEPALTLPVLLVAYDYIVMSHDKFLAGQKRIIPYIVVSAGYLLARVHALKGFAPNNSYGELSPYQLAINLLPLFREYLTSLLWPLNLNFSHSFHPINSLFEAQGIISLVAAALFSIVAIIFYRKNRLLFFCVLLIVIPLLPVFYIKAISGKPFAERYLYLPSVGYVFIAAFFLSRVSLKRTWTPQGITIVFIIIAVLFAVRTIDRNNVWKNEFNLWTDTIGRSPDFAEGHNELGSIYYARNMLERAREEFLVAINLTPDFTVAHYNLGVTYADQGHLDLAVIELQTALQLRPDFPEAHYYLGVTYADQGRLDLAVIELQTALQLRPDSPEAHYYLGEIYESQSRPDMAGAEYETALRLNPDDYKIRQHLNDIVSRRQ